MNCNKETGYEEPELDTAKFTTTGKAHSKTPKAKIIIKAKTKKQSMNFGCTRPCSLTVPALTSRGKAPSFRLVEADFVSLATSCFVTICKLSAYYSDIARYELCQN